eukprot:8682908-Karenia_brevis.AAC.1
MLALGSSTRMSYVSALATTFLSKYQAACQVAVGRASVPNAAHSSAKAFAFSSRLIAGSAATA